MPVKIFKGPINSGKTTKLAGAFLPTLKSRSGIFIVPNEHIAAEIRARLISGEKGTSAIIGDCVTTLPSFMERAAAVSKAVIGALQAALLIQKIFQSHKLKYFKGSVFFPRIARQFTAAILALKKNGVGVSRLEGILKTRGSLRENDLLTVFGLYENERERLNLMDDGDLYWVASDNIKRGKVPKLNSTKLVIFDEFDSFTPGETQLIKAIGQGLPSAEILVSCPASESGGEFFSQYLTRNELTLEKIADEVISLKADDKKHAEVSVLVTRSPLAEARTLAGLIVDEISNGNTRPEDIQTAMRSEGTFLKLFLDELKFAGIDVNISLPFMAPVVHEIFEPSAMTLWPEKARIEEYAELCAMHIHENFPTAGWQEDIKNLQTERPWVSRSFMAVSKILNTLERLMVFAGHIGLSKMRRETFLRLVTDEIFGERISWGLINRELNFRPFDSGTSTGADIVLIPQMAGGTIPRQAPERMFFSEADTLSPKPDEIIGEIFPSAEDSLAVQALQFEKFVRKCRKKLILTYSAITSSGKESSPSLFLLSFPKPIPCNPPPPMPTAARVPDFEKKFQLAAQIERERVTGEWLAEPKPEGRRLVGHPQYHGILKDKSALELVSSRYTKSTLSPTSLEKYADCPFVFFAEKILGLKPREEETPEIRPRDRGTIVHAVLEKFYAGHSNEFGLVIKGRLDGAVFSDLLDEVIEEVFLEHAEILSHSADGLKPFERAAVKTMALQVILLETAQAKRLPSPLFPKLHEWEFGDSPNSALKIPVENEAPALISGRIDRIDTDANDGAFLVVDYKTGSDIGSVKADIMKGFHLQLPLYVEAVKRFLFPTALALGGLLVAVRDAQKKHGFVRKKFDGVSYDVGRAHSKMEDDEWNEAVSAAFSAAAKYAKEIRGGNFRPKPGRECIRHCEYEEVCRHFAKGSH